MSQNNNNKYPFIFAYAISGALCCIPQHSVAKNYSSNEIDAIYAQVFGTKKASKPANVTVDLRVNGSTLRTIVVYSSNKSDIDSVETKALLEELKILLKKKPYQKIHQRFFQQAKLPFKSLKTLGVKAHYNEARASLDLVINNNIRQPRLLSMRLSKGFTVRNENQQEISPVSAYLNLFSNFDLSSEQNQKTVNLRTEASINVKGLVLQSSASYTGDIGGVAESKNKKWDVKNTRFSFDIPQYLQRYQFGEVTSSGVNFQKNYNLLGLKLSKEFYIDPTLQIRPKAGENFILEEDSTVEVHINDRLHQTFYLRKGIYAIEDIGLYAGANNIRIKITDQFGKVTEKTSEQFYDAALLKKGLSHYAFQVGIINKKSISNITVKDSPILSSYYQYGALNNLTLSLDTLVADNNLQLGTEIITAIDLGSIRLGTAINTNRSNKRGYAAQLRFSPNIFNTNTAKLNRLRNSNHDSGQFYFSNYQLQGEYYSYNFSDINANFDHAEDGESTNNEQLSNNNNSTKKKPLRASLNNQINYNLTKNWGGSLQAGLKHYYTGETTQNLRINSHKRFSNRINLNLSAQFESNTKSQLTMQLSIPLSSNHQSRLRDLRISSNSKNNQIQTNFGIKPKGQLGFNSLSANIRSTIDEKQRQHELDMNYRNPHFASRVQVNASQTKNTSNNNSQDKTKFNIGFNTSLLCAGTSCASSYPIQDSFAIISAPKNSKKPIAVNQGRGQFVYSQDNQGDLPDNYHSVINGRFRPAVLHLDSYQKQHINVDETNLPAGYNPNKTEFELFPSYRSGTHIQAGGELGVTVEGLLSSKNNKPLSLQGGQLISSNDKNKSIAFFTNSIGKFRIHSVPAGRYTLMLFHNKNFKTLNINVPKNKTGGIFNINPAND